MKKRMQDCSIHGWSLHRCKRRYFHTKKKEYASGYTEKCFKCILEGRYKKKEEASKKSAHISFRT